MGNEIIFKRCRNVGIIPPEMAVAYGMLGPGAAGERRRDGPAQGRALREVRARSSSRSRSGRRGDSYDRLWVLVERMKQSCNIIEQCMDKLPPGAFRAAKLPKTLKLDGEIYVRTENPLGLMGYYVVGDGKKDPYRLKMRTASFSNVSVIPAMLPGTLRARPDLDPRLDLLRRRRRRPLTGSPRRRVGR